MANSTSLYSTTSSGNVTIPANNNTGLYNTNVTPVSINNNISVTGNITAGGYISASGNIITSEYFIGDGSQLSNISGANIVGGYGNSNVAAYLPTYSGALNPATVSTTGNVTTASYFVGDGSYITNLPLGNYSNANVAAFLPTYTGALAGANISVTGNITGSYLFGNGSQLTGLPATYGNANVAAFLPEYGGSINANAVFGQGLPIQGYDFVQMQYSNATALPVTPYDIGTGSWFYLDAGGGVFQSNTTGTLQTVVQGNDGSVSATGNITAPYYFGNGSQLTGIAASSNYSNANVTAFLADFGSNSISTTGNIEAGNVLLGDLLGAGNVTATGNVTGAFIVGDGQFLSNVTAANAVYANTAGSAETANTANTANTATSAVTAGTVTTNAQPNITSVGTLTSVSSSGNITGAYFIGDGSELTNLPVQPGTYSNANVSGFLPIYTGDYAGANISVTGNVIGNVLKTSGVQGNITGANYVSANYFVGDGSLLTGIVSSYSNANVTAFLPTYSGNIGALTVTGNLTVTGTTTTVNTEIVNNTESVIGNVIAGNVLTGGYVSATGNVTGSYIFGNGSQLTGLAATYSNANVTTLLASFGSNTISTTGNITAGYFVGNGSTLSSITGGNVSGTVANATYAVSAGSATTATTATQATYANTANAVAGGNVSGQVANALVAGTVYTAAQPNITSVGTLTSLSSSGNITASYFLGNGSQLTGLPATYSDANVVTLLAAFGSNVISTTGNVTAGNLVLTGNIVDSAGVLQLSSAGNINLVPTSTVAITGAVSATGNITGANVISGVVTYSPTDGTVGQVLTTYGNGITYFSTVSGGGGSPGGSTTQLQYNNAGAFAGNAAMSFNNTTGNITLGNTVYNGLLVIPGGVVPNTVPTGNTNPGRMIIGNAYSGNVNWAFNITTPGTAAGTGAGVRVLQSDVFNISGGTTRVAGLGAQNYFIQNANIANTVGNIVVNNTQFNAIYGGNTALTTGYTNYSTSSGAVAGLFNNISIGSGVSPNLSAVGNTRVSFVRGATNQITLNAGSNIDVAIGTVSGVFQINNSGTSVYANIANAVAFASINTSGSNSLSAVNQSTNFSHFYIPGDVSSILSSVNAGASIVTGNVVRAATNYYAFRNDDDLAKVRLGSLNRFNEFQYSAGSTSGSVTISKNSGQVQYIGLTGNLTVAGFSNFITNTPTPQGANVYQADTVTLILNQGTTGGYTVTFPSDGTCKFAGGISAVGTVTANSVSMVSITGFYNQSAAADNYLVTISPGFV